MTVAVDRFTQLMTDLAEAGRAQGLSPAVMAEQVLGFFASDENGRAGVEVYTIPGDVDESGEPVLWDFTVSDHEEW